MNSRWAVAGLLIVVGVVGFWIFRATRDKVPAVDPSYYQTVQGTYEQLQDSRATLTDALQRGDLEALHDYMYYLQGVVDAFFKRLEPSDQTRLQPILIRLKRGADELDHFAGRGERDAATTSVTKLLAILDELKAAFEPNESPSK